MDVYITQQTLLRKPFGVTFCLESIFLYVIYFLVSLGFLAYTTAASILLGENLAGPETNPRPSASCMQIFM